MGMTVGLIDVDNTLTSSGELPLKIDHINVALLQKLKELDITNIYLFTDMILDKHWMNHRKQLIEYLESQGFNVIAVVTPGDIFWTEDFSKFKKDGFLKNALTSSEPGIAYRASLTADSKIESKLSDLVLERSKKISQNLAPLTALRERFFYPHIVKGLMLHLVLPHIPHWVYKVVVVDDRKDVIDTVKQMATELREKESAGENINQRTNLEAIRIRKLDAIHVNQLDEGCYMDLSNQEETPSLPFV